MQSGINIDGYQLPEGFDRFWLENRKRLGGSKVRWIARLVKREMARIDLEEKAKANI